MTNFRSNLSRNLIAVLAISAAAPAFAQDEIEPPSIPKEERILAAEPDSISEMFDGALLTSRLARIDLAKIYLQQLLAADPSEEDLLALRDEHGMSSFLSMARIEELKPESEQLLDRVIAAVQTKINDPEYATNLLSKLDGTARESEEALTQLRHLGAYAVPPILTAIQDQTVDRDKLFVSLARLGDSAVAPLVGALASPSDEIRAISAKTLGVLAGKDEVVWLWAPAFDKSNPPGVQVAAKRAIAMILYDDQTKTSRVSGFGVADKLVKASIDYLAGRHQWSQRYEDTNDISVWTWSPDAGTVQETITSKRRAAIHFAERLARDAAKLAPTNEKAVDVVLAARLARDIEEAGWDNPVPTGPGTAHNLAVETGPDTCLRVLRIALDNDLVGAALGATQALGFNGSRSILESDSTLVDAMNTSHPRVQFAAAVTILQWEPTQSFRGSSRVVEILSRAISSGGDPSSVIIDPNRQRGAGTASLFRELGYDSQLASTGSEGFRIAAERGDFEIGVLHPNTVRWDLTQTLQNLRTDSRTKKTPLVVLGPANLRRRFSMIQDQFENVVYINEGTSSLEISRQLQPVMNQLVPPPMTPQQRTTQSQEAAFWLRRIATSARLGVFDLARVEESLQLAVGDPNVAEDAIVALGGIGSASVQQRFAEVLSSQSMSDQIRAQAGFQLAYHIQRFGNLLKVGQISSMQLAANQTENADIKTAIASVIGSLKPTSEGTRSLILESPQPEVPVSSNDQT